MKRVKYKSQRIWRWIFLILILFVFFLFFLRFFFFTGKITFQAEPIVEGGYASLTSVVQGENIDLHISTQRGTYNLTIYREGATRETIAQILNLQGAALSCSDPGYRTGCGWPVSYTLSIPQNWKSGVYFAEFLVGTSGTSKRAVRFIVREDTPGSTSPFIVVLAENTHNAYNDVGGKSLYDSLSATDPEIGRIVSYNRPYKGYGDGSYYRREAPFIRWAEGKGYILEYATSVDLHRDAGLLNPYKVYITVGHDEYWTREMRDHLDAFVAQGGNAVILSGNTAYRQVRLSSDLRTMYGYKEAALTQDPYALDNDPSNDYLITFEWYKSPVNYPESLTTGLAWMYGGYHNSGSSFLESNGFGGYRVYHTDHWIFNGTGFEEGASLGQKAAIVGYEVDGTLLECFDAQGATAWDSDRYYCAPGALPAVVQTEVSKTPSNFLILGLAPAAQNGNNQQRAVMGIFGKPNGGSVFNAGTVEWIRGLSGDATHPADPFVQMITDTVLRTFVTTARDPISSFSISNVTVANVTSESSVINWETSVPSTSMVEYGLTTAYGQSTLLNSSLVTSHRKMISGLSGGSVYHYRVISVNASGESVASTDFVFTTLLPSLGNASEFILDNSDATVFTAEGTWLKSGASQPYGNDSVYSRVRGNNATWTLASLESGEYDVYAWWTVWNSRSTSAPYLIYNNQTFLEEKRVDQIDQSFGGTWNLLGRYYFDSIGKVVLQAESNASYSADAVRFVKFVNVSCTPRAEICENNQDEDCNGRDEICPVVLPVLGVISPQNTSYTNELVPLIFHAANASLCWYVLDSQRVNTSCSVDLRLDVGAGSHVLTVVANNSAQETRQSFRFDVLITKTYRLSYDEFKDKGATTNLSAYTDEQLGNVSLVLEIPGVGKIVFLELINLTRNVSGGIIDLNTWANISLNRVEVRADLFSSLQKKARITLYLVSLGFNKARVLKDGYVCFTPDCVIESFNDSDGVLVFNASGFSSYQAEEAPVDISDPASDEKNEDHSGGSNPGGSIVNSPGGGGASPPVKNQTRNATAPVQNATNSSDDVGPGEVGGNTSIPLSLQPEKKEPFSSFWIIIFTLIFIAVFVIVFVLFLVFRIRNPVGEVVNDTAGPSSGQASERDPASSGS